MRKIDRRAITDDARDSLCRIKVNHERAVLVLASYSNFWDFCFAQRSEMEAFREAEKLERATTRLQLRTVITKEADEKWKKKKARGRQVVGRKQRRWIKRKGWKINS